MNNLPVISGHQCVCALERAGFTIRRQTEIHTIMTRENPKTTLFVPDHNVLKHGTLHAILWQAGLNVEQFTALLKEPAASN
jgi:predicted RNA binding protein YcfA (HicA-like mRNA interferase family)